MTGLRQVDRALAVLAEGPATTVEVAAETELPIKQSCVALRRIWQLGLATRRLMNIGSTGRPAWLYTLNEAGAGPAAAAREKVTAASVVAPSPGVAR